jgi:hypothetical protein
MAAITEVGGKKMTREERLELLKQIEKDIYVCSIESTFLDDAKSCAIHSAIEELKQKSCEDCISRQDLREPRFIIAENDYQKGWNDALDSVYENAPGIQPKQNEWIPVNKRLPEKYTYTLWCSLGGNVQSDYFNGEFWEDAEKYGYEVIAWMPLPQPYKAESEE